jgi:hypothetical protein
MRKFCILLVCGILAAAASGCGTATIKPNYTSTDTDLMKIGGEKPIDKEPEIINMGSYCLKVTETWKADGKTPDGQSIWSKDSLREAVPCQ